MNELSWIGSILDAVTHAQALEEGASVVLGGILTELESSARRAGISGVKFLRAGMQLRNRDVVRFVHVLEPGAATRDVARAYLPPTAAWQWIAQHACPLVIEVQLSAAVSLDGKSEFLVPEPALSLTGPTIDRLRLRDSTHILLLPLRTEGATVGGAVWIEAQATPWIGRGFPNLDVVSSLKVLADAIAPRLRMLTPRGPDEPVEGDDLLPVVGVNTANLIELLKVFAALDDTLLIAGPTGAGKSRLARWCHARSLRAAGPFELMDLTGVPAELQMAQITGWQRGAFTGAINDFPGALTRAAGGTLFIDEIDKLSLSTQAGFLQILEERTFRPIGENGPPRNTNLRVMVGTNADLQACVKAGTFREDLYYRIHVLPVTLPSLDERKDEIPRWVRYMAQRRHSGSGTNEAVQITQDAIDMLCANSWPGNLRQLDNVVRRAYALATATDKRSPTIDAERVRQALGAERGVTTPVQQETLPASLRSIAARLVQFAQMRGVLPIKVLDGFRGLVVHAALEQTRSKEAAALLLGLDDAVANRNHQRMITRELERARVLLRLLGESGELEDLP
ncbi:MAG: sigma-54-dependent Fis family transcriptional regulator [Myxococcales bacterium]|nr:sigma-54-dependent Fis family transcriptional regulator [Myxococcales bacterium]